MGPAGQQVGWFGRTFGWENTPAAWAARLGAAGWLAGLWLIAAYAGRLGTGEIVLAVAAWFLVLAAVAREAVRDMFGPVFFYEVVRVGRRPGTIYARILYVALVAALLVLMYFSWLEDLGYFGANFRGDLVQTNAMARFATQFFEVFVVVQYGCVMLLTPVYVAGAIAVEKERKTLEFLLATDLRNREIVFGKLAARVTTLLMYVFAGLPVVAFLQLFGGIDPNLLLAAFAATVINIVGMAAVSVFMSTMLRRSRDAIVLTYMVGLVYVIGSFTLAVLAIAPIAPAAWWNQPATAFGYSLALSDVAIASADGNPLWLVLRLQNQGKGGPPGLTKPLADLFREFATFWGLVTVICIGWSVLRLRAVALHQSYGPARGAKRKKGVIPPRPRPGVGANPVFWREVFVEGGTRGGWVGVGVNVVVGILTFVWVPLIIYFVFFDARGFKAAWNVSEQWHEFTEGVNVWARVATGVLTTLMFFGVAVRAAGAVSGERDKDTWISLLGTPLSADQILWGKWWGCVLGQRRVYLLLVVIWSFGLSVGAIHPLSLPLVMASTAALVSAFAWVGLFCSIRARNSLVASIQAFFATFFLAGGFWAFLGLFCGLPLSILGARGRFIDDLVQVGLGFTPPFMTGVTPFRSASRRDMGIFDFDMHEGLGFLSLVLGLVFWSGVSVLLAAVCLWKFRRLTNRVPVYLPEELRMRAEYARRARAARKAAANGPPADAPTVDVNTLPAADRPG